MMKRVVQIVVVTLVSAACTVSDPSSSGDDQQQDDDPVIDSRYCEQTYKLTGTWTAGTPARDATTATGCWPVGSWTFTAELDPTREVGDYNNDGKADRCGDVKDTVNPTLASTYSFRVDRTDDGQGWVDEYTYTGSHQAAEIRIEVSGDGGGECEGDLELIDGDKVLLFKVAQTGTQITGYGEFFAGQKPNTF